MTIAVVDYLIREYSSLLTGKEQLAYKHLLHSEKLSAIDDDALRDRMRALMLRQGWLSESREVQALLQEGIATFRQQTAQKIYDEHGGPVLLNNCPVCQQLARTSRAKQCRYCGHNWH